MPTIRQQLLAALASLAAAGQEIDVLLLAAETELATVATVTDEQPVQTLAALSREVWEAHKAAQGAIRATYQYEKLGQPPP